MNGPALSLEAIEQVEGYRCKVVRVFDELFTAEVGRFPDGQKLLQRFNDAVDLALKGSAHIRAMGEAHNEMCIARALLLNTGLQFISVDYEPSLTNCAKSIDFRAVSSDGLKVFVDVKTVKPESKDRWEQFQKARAEDRFPDNIIFGLYEDWMGGEIWHNWYAARGRMLEYTLELEAKIRDCGLKGTQNTIFILAFCGTGFEWHESELEDFVDFYRNGRHRSDDGFARLETHFITEKKLYLDRAVNKFAYLKRRNTAILPDRLNWNVRGPLDPEL